MINLGQTHATLKYSRLDQIPKIPESVFGVWQIIIIDY